MKADIEGGVVCSLHSGFQKGRLSKTLNTARLAMKSELKLKGEKEQLTVILILMK